jgi:hypothetical protein
MDIKLNKNRYKGKPCRKCQNEIRYIRNDNCVACAMVNSKEFQKINNQTEKRKKYMREYMRKYSAENKERILEIQRKHQLTKRNKKV